VEDVFTSCPGIIQLAGVSYPVIQHTKKAASELNPIQLYEIYLFL